MVQRHYPKYCPDCGGGIYLKATHGRMLGEIEIPEDLLVPTCIKCREEYWDEGLTNEVDKLWDKQGE